MPSTRFVAELAPDPVLRRLVIFAACAALAAGIALIIRLPVSPWIRAGLCVVWIASQLFEIRRLARGARRVKLIRLDLSGATVVNRHDREEPARIMSGSVVLRRVAWLRLKLADGQKCGELLLANPANHQQWRHLQVLWRFAAGSFGGPA
ncbi:MAG: hypothetical protein ACE5KS_02790 [Woeseiaceae bacterium]